MRDRILRVGLWFLALGALAPGAWALFAPEHWHRAFPLGASRPWVAAVGAYSEHLTRDVGALFLAFGAIFVLAAVTLDRMLVRASLIGTLFFDVPHLLFHLRERGTLSDTDYVLNVASLSGAVALVIALLVLAWSRPPQEASATAPAP